MGESLTHSIIVKGQVEDVYEAWADFESFPSFMKHIESVDSTGDGGFRWVMKGPMGRRLEWDTEVTLVEENKRIGWRTIEGDIKTSGQVTFTQLPPDETQITLMYHYEPPAGKLGEAGAQVFGDPEQRVVEDLRNFKSYFEGMPGRLSTDD